MKKKPRVLIDSFHLVQALTGIRTYTTQLLSGLEELDQEDVVYLIYPNWRWLNNTQFLRGRVNPFKKVLNHILYFLWKQIVLPALILFKRVDLIVALDYLLPRMKFGARSITVFHDTFYWELKSNYNPVWRTYFIKSVKAGLDKDSLIVVTTDYIGDKVRKIVSNEHLIRVIYQAPKGLPQSINSDSLEIIQGLPIEARYFMHIGIFEQRKNLELLVRAFDRVSKREYFKDYLLVLAGGKGVGIFHDDFATITKLIKLLELEKKVIIPGFVPDGHLNRLYENAFAYVFPSKEEGFGIPVIEAMRAKIPVIISNQPALMEVAGDAALVFEMNNEKELVNQMLSLKDEHLQKSLIKKGNLRAKKFTRETFAEQFHSVVLGSISKKF